MKTCFKCHRRFALSQFYRHAQMADGHLNKCKECTKKDVRTYYQSSITDPAYQNNQRQRGRDKYHRLYSSAEVRARDNARNRALRCGPNWTSPEATDEEKRTARQSLSNAIRDGAIVKPRRCQDCKNVVPSRRLHGHHTDYLNPLDVQWLCSTCHRRAHATHPERVKSSQAA